MNDESLRVKVRNMSKMTGVSPYLIMQNFFLERFLYRISKSTYQRNIIVKGGVLVSSLIGIENRTTKDLDARIFDFPMKRERIAAMIQEINTIDCNDGVRFEYVDLKEIREEDEYTGFRVRDTAKLGKINQRISIDISTGDIITPRQIRFYYEPLFSEEKIKIWAYNVESILAEKVETILSRGILNTRMRDFYDVHMLWCMKKGRIQELTLKKALINTFGHRDSSYLFEVSDMVLDQIVSSGNMHSLWNRYCDKNDYTEKLEFEDALVSVNEIMETLNNK